MAAKRSTRGGVVVAESRQLNVRLPEECVDVLEAAAFVRKKTTAAFIRDSLSQHIEKLKQDPDVARAVVARKRRRLERKPKRRRAPSK